MSVVQGNIKLRVEMTGDGTSAKAAVKGVREEVDKTTKSGGLLSDSAGKIKSKVGEIKGSVGGVNAVREGFENLRSNIGFVAGAVGGLVFGLMEVAQALNGNNVAIGAWEKIVNDVVPAIDRAKASVRALREELGELSPETPLKRALDSVYESAVDLTDKLSTGQAAISAYNSELERIAVIDMTGFAQTLGAVEEIEKRRNLALTRANEMTERLIDATNRYSAALKRVQTDANTFVGPPTEAGYDPMGGDIVVVAPGKGWGKKPPGGGGGGKADDTEERWQKEVERRKREAARTRIIGEASAGGNIAGGGAGGDGSLRSSELTKLEQLATTMQKVADATQLAAERMPEFGRALSEIQGITEQFVAGKMSLNQALIAGGAAIAANAARAVGGVRAEAAVRAAYEYGMGFATLETPIISAGHFTAAGVLTAVAAGAGKGGGSGAHSGGGAVTSARSTRVSTATTLGEGPFVQNINAPWFGGLQEGGAYLWQVGQRAVGTGYARAA